MTIETALPGDEAAARAALYAGRIFRTAATAASAALVEAASALLRDELGEADVRARAGTLAPNALFAAIGRIRRVMFAEASWRDAVRQVIGARGFDPDAHAFEPPRLRVVLHRGHDLPAAAPVYLAHRDTWYAHPQALLTWWLPLDDLAARETFVFYPALFAAAVANDSERFCHAAWTARGPGLRLGWQEQTAAHYPGLTGEVGATAELGFACARGATVMFSGAHLHRTLRQATGRARFSLDFRTVHLADAAAGRGAPNVDNRSRGSALPLYVQPGGTGGRSARASTSAPDRLAAKSPGTRS